VIAPFGCEWCKRTFILFSKQTDFCFFAACIDNNDVATDELEIVGVVRDLFTHFHDVMDVDLDTHFSSPLLRLSYS